MFHVLFFLYSLAPFSLDCKLVCRLVTVNFMHVQHLVRKKPVEQTKDIGLNPWRCEAEHLCTQLFLILADQDHQDKPVQAGSKD